MKTTSALTPLILLSIPCITLCKENKQNQQVKPPTAQKKISPENKKPQLTEKEQQELALFANAQKATRDEIIFYERGTTFIKNLLKSSLSVEKQKLQLDCFIQQHKPSSMPTINTALRKLDAHAVMCDESDVATYLLPLVMQVTQKKKQNKLTPAQQFIQQSFTPFSYLLTLLAGGWLAKFHK